MSTLWPYKRVRGPQFQCDQFSGSLHWVKDIKTNTLTTSRSILIPVAAWLTGGSVSDPEADGRRLEVNLLHRAARLFPEH